VRRAEQLDADVVVFTGWSSTGGPSEAEQMRELWAGPPRELVLEPRARNTAENAVYSLRVLLERGDVESATVVCSVRHRVRVPYFFGRLFREHGIEAGYDFVRRPLPAPGRWLEELVGLALMRKHRRDAQSLW
jgi:uncharacterized SAM-binding protein YcdF (DUF218 family)